MQKNDQSSLIGILLIGILIFTYPIFFPGNDIDNDKTIDNNQKIQEENITKNIEEESTKKVEEENDSKNIEKEVSEEKIIEEKEFILENNKIKLIISNYGGEITSARIKNFYNYKDYDSKRKNKNHIGKDIEIFNNKDSKFKIIASRNINTDNKVFDVILHNKNKNILTLRKDYSDNSFIEYKYILKENTNFLEFEINSSNIQDAKIIWDIATPLTVKSKINQQQYTGFYYQEDHSKDVDYTWDNNEYENIGLNLSWVAFKQQFFSTIIIPENSFNSNTEMKVSINDQKEYIKDLSLRTNLNNNKNNFEIYFGPNDYKSLKSYNSGYEEIIPLGWSIIGWVNKYIVINIFDILKNKAGIQNIGLIILLLTLIIKFVLSPLTYKSYLSQAKMKVLKPEIDKINEKNKGKDPMKTQQETMGLYRKAGVNPLGGCLPMLIQFPILIAMFRFFPASIELRQEAFLWADDLSAYDSIADLPFNIPFYGSHVSLFTLLMTISTLLYTHMNMQMSSAQMPGMKWMMYLMPVMFLGFLNSYASSLSYYYFLANIFTFSQMYLMRKLVDDKAILAQLEANKKKPPKPKSRFQKKLEQMQRDQEKRMKKRK